MTAATYALLAALALAAPTAQALAETPARTVSVTGEGVVLRVPDRAAITIGVEEMRETAVEAMNAASEGAEGVIAALRQVGIPERDIATIDISLGPVRRQRRAEDGGIDVTLDGYRATNVLRVTVSALDRLGAAIGAATSAGGNTVSSIAFEASDAASAHSEALALAVADAREKARTLADAAGAKLGPVLIIEERGGAPSPMRMEMARAADGAPPVSAGARAISAAASVTWSLED